MPLLAVTGITQGLSCYVAAKGTCSQLAQALNLPLRLAPRKASPRPGEGQQKVDPTAAVSCGRLTEQRRNCAHKLSKARVPGSHPGSDTYWATSRWLPNLSRSSIKWECCSQLPCRVF